MIVFQCGGLVLVTMAYYGFNGILDFLKGLFSFSKVLVASRSGNLCPILRCACIILCLH